MELCRWQLRRDPTRGHTTPLKNPFFTPHQVNLFRSACAFFFCYSPAQLGSGEPEYGQIGVEMRICHGGPCVLYMEGDVLGLSSAGSMATTRGKWRSILWPGGCRTQPKVTLLRCLTYPRGCQHSFFGRFLKRASNPLSNRSKSRPAKNKISIG